MRMTRSPLVALVLAAGAASVLAEVPRTLGVQGQLSVDGRPVTTSTSLTMRLMDAPTGGSQLAGEQDAVFHDARGVFTTLLGDGAALQPSVFTSSTWLELEPEGAGGPLQPRLELVPAPQALRAAATDGVSGAGLVTVPAGPDALANGQALRDAVAAAVPPGLGSPALVRLLPGIYDVGATPLQMRQNVDLQGAGRGVTWILSRGSSSSSDATVIATDFPQTVSSLTIACETSSEDYCTAVRSTAGRANWRDVEIRATGAAVMNVGVECTVSAEGPRLFDSWVYAAATGGADATGVSLSGPTDLNLEGTVVKAVTEDGSAYALVGDSGSRFLVFHSDLKAEVTGTGHATAVLTNGLPSLAVILFTQVTASQSGSATGLTTGVDVLGGTAELLLHRTTISASGSTGIHTGMRVGGGSTVNGSSTLIWAPGASNRGLAVIGTGSTVNLDSGSIQAGTAVLEEAGNTVRMGGSKLAGTRSILGVGSFPFCYDGSYTPLPPDPP